MKNETQIALALNDGWFQLPPKEDGEYWMANAKPWHSENAYDPSMMVLVKIEGGHRVAVMENAENGWTPPECDAPGNPVWDSESQFELMAAWRIKRDGENFANLPPMVTSTIFERHPATCSVCGGTAATYDVWHELPNGATVRSCPRVCYSCGHEEAMDKSHFNLKFAAALRSALSAIKTSVPSLKRH